MNLSRIDNISTSREVGTDYFKLGYRRDNRMIKRKLSEWLDMFDVNDYYIIKASGAQRVVSLEDLLTFKYSGYTFFKKEKHNLEHIENWIDFINKELGCVPYISMSLPPFSPNKIIIK